MTRVGCRSRAMLAATALVAACATPETRLRTGLVEAGLAEPLAGCMAERMVDRLSVGQLSRLGDLRRAGEAPSVDVFLHRVRSLGDREIWTVTSSSAALCATGLAG
ncbi:MAG: hypothetical protein ACXWUN_00015 [Allosphingosinicella sp.]